MYSLSEAEIGGNMSNWELYDRLIQGIDENIEIEDVLQRNWWLVKTRNNLGISMYFEQGEAARTLPTQIKGLKLKELAKYIKSWNFYEATLAIAAINAFYNTRQQAESLNCRYSNDAFKEFTAEIAGKNVAVIGHFPLVEKLNGHCKLSILEKNPSLGDYPDSACEYILGEQDYVFITGTTFANKTLPRLLQLSHNAKVIMTGPSVPLTSILFEYGVNVIAGSIAWDFENLWTGVEQGMSSDIFTHGARMLQIEP